MNKLFVGLDIGTESIGYAVTSEDYSLCKINGKDMWGVRLFNEADTAIERRAFRTSRRRIERRKLRVELLQELFAKEISTKDPGFFMRLSDSFYIAEDKTDKQPYSLFSGKEYNDVFYHAEYPTIYHLRKALINGQNLDIRLLYLAIHHIIKYRGHFLFGNQDFSAVLKIDGLILSLNNLIAGEQSSGFDTSRLQALECAMLENKMTVTAKKKKFAEILLPTTSCEKEMIAIISGGKVGTAKLFGNELYADSEVKSIQFSDVSFEEIALPKLEGFLAEEEFEILQILKGIYDWTVLFGILDGETQISFAMCKRYEKHSYDLKTLKALIKDKYPLKYNMVFRKDKLYSAYIGTVKTKNKKEIVKKVTDKDVFYKELRKILETKDENILSDERYQYIKAEMETSSFLPKQVSSENSVLPYQLNKNELSIILENAENHFEFLKSSDGKYTISEKIKMLLEFRIPYYVGPLNNHHEEKGFAWVVRKKEGRVTPWNFEEKVDIEASGEKFITKMTNKCSYLTCENVIAKDSMLYQKFMVLNEINNIKVNGQAITVEIKQRIFNELFLRLGKVSKKTLRTFMYEVYGLKKTDTLEITGIDEDIKSSMSSYIKFNNIFGNMNQENINIAENIIRLHALYEDKVLVRKRIKLEYSERFSSDILSKLINLSFKGWGRLSQALLCDVYHINKETGEILSIIDNMWDTNNNLMELLSNHYSYTNQIDKINGAGLVGKNKVSYEDIENLPTSPSVKRQIWQSFQVVNELVRVSKREPDKIFIEMARGGGEKGKRTISRKRTLVDLYSAMGADGKKFVAEINEKDDSRLQSDKLYLYYTQMGRCMYSGDNIDLEDLMSANTRYDIDHIYPQSKVKDDSLENRVLVKKELNQNIKKDIYPLPSEWQQQLGGFWYELLKKGLIGKKKYERLVRKTSFTQDELADFIDRQLVETRQTTKYVASILKAIMPNTKIVYVKAGSVSEFRHDKNLIKIREINDLHHANDAYLNIVVGNTFDTKFGSNARIFIKESKEQYNMRRMFDFDVKRGEYYAWKQSGEKNTISKVKKTLAKNTPIVSRYTFCGKGGLFDQNIVKAKDGLLPIKGVDERLAKTEIYGGYNSKKTSYFVIIEHTQRKKRIMTIETVPIMFKDKFENNESEMLQYMETLGYIDVRIVCKKIKIKTLFEINGARLRVAGKTNQQIVFHLAQQAFFDYKTSMYIKNIVRLQSKVSESRKKGSEYIVSAWDKVSAVQNIELFDILIKKLQSKPYVCVSPFNAIITKTEQKREMFNSLGVIEQSSVLIELIKFLQNNAVKSDLSILGEGKVVGSIYLSKNFKDTDTVKIINQSPTGIFETVIDIRTQS